MALARGTQIRPTDFNLPVLQLPFEQIMAQMTTAQQDYDMFDQLSQMMPKNIKQDDPYVQKYRNYVDAITQDVAQSFASGNTEQAIRKLESGKRALASEWNSGGIAYGIQNRYDAYMKGLEELKKAHEKDPTGMNRLYGEHMFTKGIKDFDYDPVSRTGNVIGSPTIYNYVDINQKLMEAAKAMDVDMTEQDVLDGRWIIRMKEKGVGQGRIDQILNGIFQSPDVRQQMGVEFWSKTGHMTDDERKALGAEGIQKNIEQIEAQRTKLNKMAPKERQTFLKGLGLYKGAIDGIEGDLTKNALSKYNEYLDEQKESYTSYDPDEYLMDRLVADPYKQTFRSYFGRETSQLMRANPYALADYQFRLKMKLQDREFDFQRKLMETDVSTGLITPSRAMDVGKEIGNFVKDTKESFGQAKSQFGKVYGSDAVKKALGTTGNYEQDYNKLDKMLRAYDKSQSLEEYAAAMGMTPKKAESSYAYLQDNASDVSRSMQSMAELKSANENITKWERGIYDEMAKSKVDELYKKYRVSGETREQFLDNIIKASQLSVNELNKNEKYKRFVSRTGSGGIGGGGGLINIAQSVRNQLQAETQAKVNAGHTLTGMATFSISGTDPKFGAGRITSEVKAALKGNFAGLADVETGNLDKFKNLADPKKKEIKLQNIDPESIEVRVVKAGDRKFYRIEGKDMDGNRVAIASQIPETHNAMVAQQLTNEFANAVNTKNMSAAKGFALSLEGDDKANIIGLANPTFDNDRLENDELTYGSDKRFRFSRPHQTVARYDTGGGNVFQIIKFKDSDGDVRFANVLVDAKGNRYLMGKPTFDENGQIDAKGDHKSLSDLFYDNADDARESAILFKQNEEVPIEETLQDIPKSLMNMGLGQKVPGYPRVTTDYGFEINLEEADFNDN